MSHTYQNFCKQKLPKNWTVETFLLLKASIFQDTSNMCYLWWVGTPRARGSVNHCPSTMIHTHIVHLATQVMEVLREVGYKEVTEKQYLHDSWWFANLLRCGPSPVHVCGEFTTLGWSACPTLPSPELGFHKKADDMRTKLKMVMYSLWRGVWKNSIRKLTTVALLLLYIGQSCHLYWGGPAL